MVRGKEVLSLGVESDMETFSDDVQSYHLVYSDQSKVKLFISKNFVSSTGREEDVELKACPPGEIVCVLELKACPPPGDWRVRV